MLAADPEFLWLEKPKLLGHNLGSFIQMKTTKS